MNKAEKEKMDKGFEELEKEKLSCPVTGCSSFFTLKRNLVRHLRVQHNSQWTCKLCHKIFNRVDNFEKHQRTCEFRKTGKRPAPVNDSSKVSYRGGALDDALSMYSIDMLSVDQTDILTSLRESILSLRAKLDEALEEKRAIKYTVSIHVLFHQSTDKDFLTEPPIVLRAPTRELLRSSPTTGLEDTFANLLQQIDDFQDQGSGWVLNSILRLDLDIVEYHPLQASSYISLPSEIANKKAVVNIRNKKDKKCLLWSVIAGTYMKNEKLHDPQLPGQYKKHEDKFNVDGITFPVMLAEIPKFERLNKNVSVSVYGYEKNIGVYPLKVSREKREHHVNLLLISNDDTNHYCYIKDFNKLVSSQCTKNGHKTYFCRFCLHGFSKGTTADGKRYYRTDEEMKANLKVHEETCFSFSAQRTSFPVDPIVKFKAVKKQLKAPLVVYADMESMLRTCSDRNKVQEHHCCSYAYKIVSNIPGVKFEPKIYFGEDAATHFLDSLQDDLDNLIMPIIEKEVKMIWDDEAQQKLDTATHCHICEKELVKPELQDDNNRTVRDHDHLTGLFVGASHNSCNIKYQLEKKDYKLPVFFHNMAGYDAHLIFQKVKTKHGKIDVIANNSERYISFNIGRLKFLDSYKFLSSSIDNLAAQLNPDQLVHLSRAYPDPTQRSLLSKKGVYPYDYMDSFSRFDETSLPNRQQFFNSLENKHITTKQYRHAENVWKGLDCKTMKDYHSHYQVSDILLLADIFENFRAAVHETYKLDPAHFYSLPGLSWDAMLKYTGVEIELITDPDMYQMVEKGKRGGISQITHRFAEANHPLMEDYNPKKERKTLMYQDANALYSWAMTQFLPLRNFSWASTDTDFLSVPADSTTGYILEVDLEYPTHLHDTHNDYPLAPEHMKITNEMLSPYQQENFPSIRGSVQKLVPNLLNKTKYVLHYRNLQLYVNLGMKLTKVHRAISFEQSPWMAPYINLNIEKRKEAVMKGDNVGKDMYKLFNNSLFGKTCENLRNHINFDLVTTKKAALKRFAKPYYKSSVKFREDLVGIHLLRPNIELNRPIQVGCSILDLSKTLMYDFHYNVWMKTFPNSKLLFTDTDSLAYEVTGHDVDKGLESIEDLFDFSEYPKEHPLYSPKNLKVIGKFKDECQGRLMLKYVGLQPKLYGYEYLKLAHFLINEDGIEEEIKRPTEHSTSRVIVANKKVGKGIKNAVRDTISVDDYEQCLTELEPARKKMRTIRSDKHELYTYEYNKIALSAFDDKRWILDDGIGTLAHGHYNTQNQSI